MTELTKDKTRLTEEKTMYYAIQTIQLYNYINEQEIKKNAAKNPKSSKSKSKA